MDWKKLKGKVAEYSTELKSISILGSNEISQFVSNSEWFRSLNEYSSEVSKAMDSEFLLSLKGQATEKMAPTYHRIVDGGHDFFSSIEEAQKIGSQNNWTDIETFQEWAKSYLTDLSSPAGMPAFGKMSESIYNFLKEIGINEETARDTVTINGQEAIEALLSGGITFLALYYSWKKEDKEIFSKTVASILLTSTLMLNPVSFLVALVGLGIGYNKMLHKEAMARGAIITGSGLLLSSLIPGPVILGAIPGLVLSIYVSKKMGKKFNPIENSKAIYGFISSKEFQVFVSNFHIQHLDKSNQEAS